MRPGTIAFTETWLKKASKDSASRGKPFTDALCRGLMCWIAKDGVVTFSFRTRVKGVQSRVYEKLGIWSAAFSVLQARDAANTRRTEISLHGLKKKIDAPTLAGAIPKYELARRSGDPLASRRGAPLRADWPEHIERFKKVFKGLLELNTKHLSRDDFMGAMETYGVACAAETGKEWDRRVLRPMMVCTMPMLRWCYEMEWLDERAIKALVPADYDKDERYLLPGEWQACAPHIDALEDDCGLFERFVLTTCVRSEQALCMEWSECNWDEPEKFTDARGVEHEAVIWIVPKQKREGRMKGRGVGGEANTMNNRVLLVGESLAILRRLRAIYEAGRDRPENAGYTRVFTKTMVTRWRTARTTMQRGIETAAGTKPWDRMTLRHTHSTWLTAIGCPKRLVTMSMVHTAHDEEGAAPITDRYIGADAARRFMDNDPLAQLAPWHLKLHQLIRDIEAGHLSDLLAGVIGNMRNGQVCNNMCERYAIDRKFISIEVRSQPPKLQVVGM